MMRYGAESKISVGGDSFWPGAQGVSAVFVDRRLRRGLCLANEPDLPVGPADQKTRTAPGGIGGPKREAEKAVGDHAVAQVPRSANQRTEPGTGRAADLAGLAVARAGARFAEAGARAPISGAG